MRVLWRFSFFIISGLILMVAGCSTSPVHTTLVKSDLPELIPLREFFLNVDTKFGYQISPDGKKLAWLEPKNRRLTIYFKSIGTDDIQTIDSHSSKPIYGVAWLQDN